jgi:hypothetical protein
MLQSYFVDGDKGGVGKSTVARYVADMLINAEKHGAKKIDHIYIIDADASNADVCGPGGYRDEEIDGTQIHALHNPIRSDKDWTTLTDTLAEKIDQHEGQEVRIVFSLPAAAGLIIVDNPVIAEQMEFLNGTPVWVMGSDDSSVEAIERRAEALPDAYQKGFIVVNLKHGSRDAFRAWDTSKIRKKLVDKGGWQEIEFLTQQAPVMLDLGRTPPHRAVASREGADGKRLGVGTHIAVKHFCATMGRRLAVLEEGLSDE